MLRWLDLNLVYDVDGTAFSLLRELYWHLPQRLVRQVVSLGNAFSDGQLEPQVSEGL